MAGNDTTATVADRAHRPFYGWRILALFWFVIAVNLGFPMYGATVLNSHMSEALNLSATMLGLSFSIFMLMLGLPSPLVALCVERLGVRLTLVGGSALIVLGAVLMATAVHGPIEAAVVFGLLVGLGVAFGSNLATQVGIGRWFVRRRALALAIMFSANGVGGAIAAPLLEWMVSTTSDWRSGWLLLGALSGLAGLASAIVARDRPEDVGQLPDGSGSMDEPGQARVSKVFISQGKASAGEIIRTRIFWKVTVGIVANYLALSLVISHGVPHLRGLGHDATAAAWAISLVSGGTLLGKLLLGGLGDRIEPHRLWTVSTCLIAFGLLAAPWAGGRLGFFIFPTLFGIGFGGALVMQTAVLMNFFGLKAFPQLLAIALLVQTGFSAVVPLLAGIARDALANYDLIFLAAGMINLLAALNLLLLVPPREDKQ